MPPGGVASLPIMRAGPLIGLGFALLSLLCPSAVPAVEAEKTDAPRSCFLADPAAPPWTAVCIRQEHFFRDTCSAIYIFAWRERLPEGYFARLIWQESRFDPTALSTAGAQGIAQFIPSTARLRGLADPFDPSEALAKSARYLRFLANKYGNLGLAAVAYNSGEARASSYVNAGGNLPGETREYVQIITGLAAEAWLTDVGNVDYALNKSGGFLESCVKMAEAEEVPRMDLPPGEWKPWGVMLAQNFSQGVVVRRFERVQAAYSKVIGDEKMMLLMARNPSFGPRLRHIAMIGREKREDAEALCARLQNAGGACIVRKN